MSRHLLHCLGALLLATCGDDDRRAPDVTSDEPPADTRDAVSEVGDVPDPTDTSDATIDDATDDPTTHDDPGVEDTSVVEDTSTEDTSAEDTSTEDTSTEDTSTEDTSVADAMDVPSQDTSTPRTVCTLDTPHGELAVQVDSERVRLFVGATSSPAYRLPAGATTSGACCARACSAIASSSRPPGCP